MGSFGSTQGRSISSPSLPQVPFPPAPPAQNESLEMISHFCAAPAAAQSRQACCQPHASQCWLLGNCYWAAARGEGRGESSLERLTTNTAGQLSWAITRYCDHLSWAGDAVTVDNNSAQGSEVGGHTGYLTFQFWPHLQQCINCVLMFYLSITSTELQTLGNGKYSKYLRLGSRLTAYYSKELTSSPII